MKNKFIDKLFTLILLYICMYIGLFITLNLFTPDIGTLNIQVNSNEHNPELKEFNISTNQINEKYFILIYEDSSHDNWLYFNSKIHNKDSDIIISKFIPNLKNNYILLEGDKFNNEFNFSIKSKFPLTHMANKEYKFHIFFIVPYKLFLFPSFYYSKHTTFFLDPII